ncbi:acetamidase/formamidase family protein [Actinoalloteichus sp. GBA129-24]|uniref:acetamidase/formamidase family protein n=1 Tax=Actinoalloteichus sp. GBA129-24 TaxID=1612551 RepID=UPI0009509693|nr:acetamidase/formamidase family protein [Actinoalloteichus sp. GBA129-24]APU22022.1 putative acetamidase/formamidase [Actinoalloteichus sp. GBA129-24]
MSRIEGARADRTLRDGLGRRTFFLATAGLAAGAGASLASPAALATPGDPAGPDAARSDLTILQPGGRHQGTYVPADADSVLWGRLPNRATAPVATIDSGSVVTVDTISHEGILADQGRDPRGYFGEFGVSSREVLRDAVEIARRTPQDGPGPHVITGPVAVRGAEPGQVLKVEVLDLRLRVPYGVISNRHGRGALPGEYPEAWVGDPALRRYFNQGGEISIFVRAERRGKGLVGALPGPVSARFPLRPFLGVMGVARDTGDVVDSVPPTDAGGNIDVSLLGVGSTLYLPVQVAGGMFFTGDPHMAQGDGEVALTAMEGSLRATLRLTAVSPGGPAPKAAFGYPFAETAEHWIPLGLSDAEGGADGGLDAAMRTAVRHAMQFLTEDLGMAGPVAYAYLSAASDFAISQVVDRTTGVHGLIRKADFD